MRAFFTLLIGAAAIVIGASQAHAQGICGRAYVAQPGDTLPNLAQAIYQDAQRWRDLYEFQDNARQIGLNPSRIPVGASLILPPCPEGLRPPQVLADADEQLNPVDVIELVTASNYPPFTDESALGRGMATQIVQAAFAASDLGRPVHVEFINHWGSHLQVLLRNNKYEFGFPWVEPDCFNAALLPPGLALRCEYVFSEPIYGFSVAYFGRREILDTPRSFSELQGRTICRPAGYQVADLARRGLQDGVNIAMTRAASVTECFELLQQGEVDFVSLNRFVGERAVSELGLTDIVAPIPTLVDQEQLRLVAHQDNANAAYVWMREFNKGLERIRENGEWGRIVAWHLQEHSKGVAR